MQTHRDILYRRARLLALITIGYNILEGLVSVYFGLEDETLALLGFGMDSFVEVISGIGVWHMVRRQASQPDVNPDQFEKQALRITGLSFYLLTFVLMVSSLINGLEGHRPETTFWGIVISLISIVTMGILIHFKMIVGRALNSRAIVADAHCTRACLILSLVLLVASVAYEMTGLGGIDVVGSLLIAWFSFREGRESFEKARGIACSCNGACQNSGNGIPKFIKPPS
jgi:divalent metal cation (Fe/Co/Zn/Cd) transporter